MADDLNQPYIGYRSAGRRRPELNDRAASANAPLAALRGLASGVLGAPGDIESLVRMLPGLSEQTFLPTSEDIERRLPLRSISETPVGRAATGAGQIGGGFYTGPGSPLRAIAGLPSAVSRAGRDFVMAAGQPAVNVVKPKGGNWLAGSIEREIAPMRVRVRTPGINMHTEEMAASDAAMNRWLENKLAKYIKNEMGTAEDPIRALAESWPARQQGLLAVKDAQIAKARADMEAARAARGFTPEMMTSSQARIRELEKERELIAAREALHAEILPTGYNVARARREAGFPEEGMGVSPLAKTWEDRADTFINPLKASDLTGHYPEAVKENPWLLKVPPETPVYEMLQGSAGQGMLGFGHLVDELKNALNPASGLPPELLLKYTDLEKKTVPDIVNQAADINAWRAVQKAEADALRAMGPAVHTFKEYPEQGFKWVELKAPKETGRKIGVEKPEMDLPPDFNERMGREVAEDMAFDEGLEEGTREFNDFVRRTMDNFNRKKTVEMDESVKALEDALKYEGETMGHCVGGYCPDVIEGRSKIFSLRDKKGQPHVTIEVAPRPLKTWDDVTAAVGPDEARKLYKEFDEIGGYNMDNTDAAFDMFIQNKGIKPAEDIVQIKGKANRAPNPEYLPAVQDFVRSQNWSNVGDLKNAGLVDLHQAGVPAEMRGGQRFVTEDEYKDIVRKNAEGFAMGGLVQKYADGGLVGSNLGGSNIYNSDAMQDPASAYRFADGGQAGDVRAYADGGLVANSHTADFDPARIDAIVGDLNALNAG